jgi:diguanylate cyclase (GGDEF)-like protein
MPENSEVFNKKTADSDNCCSLIKQISPLAQKINCLDIDSVAEVCIHDIPELLGVRFASVYVMDETNGILHLLRYNHPYLLNKIVSLNQNPPSPMVLAVQSKELILVANIDTHKRPVIRKSQRVFAEKYKTKNCAIVPLICHDNVVGVLNFADKINGDSFNSDDISLIQLFGQLVGASIGNIKMFEKIQYQATTDGMTGLANHRTFYDILERELFRIRRYGGKIAIIMIDIDNLKKINDTFGHRLGDKVIQKVSKKIKECIRQIDTAARYGGDEFAIILPNTDHSEARLVAERMVNAVSGSPILWKNEQIVPSISIGLGEYGPETNPEDMTSRSDLALYIAKQAGKNTVRVFEPSLLNKMK